MRAVKYRMYNIQLSTKTNKPATYVHNNYYTVPFHSALDNNHCCRVYIYKSHTHSAVQHN